MEQSHVQYGHTRIRFRVQRSPRRKQVSLVVERSHRRLLVLAPVDVEVARLRALVRQRGAWVLAKLRHVRDAEVPATAHEFVSGEGFSYLGRSFRLRVREAAAPEPARLDGAWLVVTVRHLGLAARRQAVRAAVIAWFKARAAERLPERLTRFVARLERSQPRLLLRDQARRWGSCSSNAELRLNWRIVQAPMRLVDYVVAHEAVHLVHRNHTAAYWSALAKLIPEVDARRAELRLRGSALVW